MENNLYGLISLLGIAAIFWLYFRTWKDLCIDEAREDFFAARERLFNLALDGKMDFDSTNYKDIRSSIDKLIRFSHEITIWRLIITSLFVDHLIDRESKLQQAFDSIRDEDLKHDVLEVIKTIQSSILTLVLKRSILFVSIVYVLTKIWTLFEKATVYYPNKVANGVIWIAEKSDENSDRDKVDILGLHA